MLDGPVIAKNSRERRDFACESKFLLTADQALLIRDWARRQLSADAHGTGGHGDEYRVSSIYFDTPALDVFQRRGSYGRSKYRIRRYNAGELTFLERKTKTSQQVSKRRTLVPVAELHRLPTAPDASWAGWWFQRRLQLRGLQPVCRISYQRLARLGMGENGPCRLTLDHQLEALPRHELSFDGGSGQALLPPGRYILELKYRYHLPVLFRQLLNEFAPVPQSLSKYRLAVAALGLATPLVAESCEAV